MGTFIFACFFVTISLPSRRETNSDGRCMDLLPARGSEEAKDKNVELKAGSTYKIVFKTKDYFEGSGRRCFYPWVEVLVLHKSLLYPIELLVADTVRSPQPHGALSYTFAHQPILLYNVSWQLSEDLLSATSPPTGT